MLYCFQKWEIIVKIALIDMGSNTVRLVIYEADKVTKTFTKLFDYKKMLQILMFIKNKKLSKTGFNMMLDILQLYQQIANAYGVKQFYCFATASLRNLKNLKEILLAVEKNCGIKIHVIDGNEEARLGFLAVKATIDLPTDGISVDVGGGSTEIVYYQKQKIVNSVSLPIGSLSLSLNYLNQLFPDHNAAVALTNAINQQLDTVFWLKNIKVQQIIGIGGTARCLCKLSKELYKTPKIDHGDTLDCSFLHQIASLDCLDDLKIARQVITTSGDRCTTIIPGSMILSQIAKRVNASTFILSRYGIREGYLLHSLGAK